MRYIFLLIMTFLIVFAGCGDDEVLEQNEILNLSDDFAVCNSRLSKCVNGDGAFCLFGYKWGIQNPFDESGYDASGPQLGGGILTYSFQEENGLINTHAQINLPSQSFSSLTSCARTEIRRALNDWSEVAAVNFEESPDNSSSDIRFFVADIRQSGVGYPNYTESPCTSLGGNVVIKNNLSITDCDEFYLFALHEIGHVLGLGHVSTENVMNPELIRTDLAGLQEGDINGIIEIYGAK